MRLASARIRSWSHALVGCGLTGYALLGCAGADPIGSNTTTAPRAEIVGWRIVPAETTSVVSLPCEAEERTACDALDNDCDGHIDEDCSGLERSDVSSASETSVLELAATWSTGADVDLVVTPRPRAGASQQSQAVPSLKPSVRGEGDCGSPESRSDSRLERFWLSASDASAAVRGFTLRVHRARECNIDGGTHVSIAISAPSSRFEAVGGEPLAAPTVVINASVDPSGAPVWVADIVPLRAQP